ncbi:MAG: squalene/phytoene synthase family protein [Rhodanobacteraceae bacterium]
MSDSAFDGYLTQWREASPQRAAAWRFLHREERVRYGALAALENEWLRILREVREPQVAAAKLGWWREEMQRAMQGQARHPLTQVLFADVGATAVPAACWAAPIDAAMMVLAPAPAPDLAAQCEGLAPLAGALAVLETQLWFGPCVDSTRASRVTLFARLASGLRALATEVGYGRSPLPMNLLARHGLTIDGLARDDPARRAALRDYGVELERGFSDAAGLSGPLTLFRAIDLRHNLLMLARASRAEDPMAALHAPAYGLGEVLKTWHEARMWRSMLQRRESRS